MSDEGWTRAARVGRRICVVVLSDWQGRMIGLFWIVHPTSLPPVTLPSSKAQPSSFRARFEASVREFLGCCVPIFLTLAPSFHSQAAVFNPAKVIIIKADDFKVPTQAWTNFMASSRSRGVKVGLGAVVKDIPGDAPTAQWMQDQQAVGDVEFWNHGWDHSTWTTGGTTYWEFSGSGLSFQQTHFSDAQAGLLGASGRNCISFGAPYNQTDANTMAVMNATPAVRLFFTYNASAARNAGLAARVSTIGIIAEAATGKPLASSFINSYPNGPAGPVSLQFHPAAFTAPDLAEYEKIIQFLIGKGYTFMLPAEYIAALDGPPGGSTNTAPVATGAEISTPTGQTTEIDLRALASDVETPAAGLQFSVGPAVNGSVVLLADGHTAQFTPTGNFTGSANFTYSVRDNATDPRTLLNYNFQLPDVTTDGFATDVSGYGRNGTFAKIGAGTYTYTTGAPPPLAAWHTRSLNLYQNGMNDSARLICGLSGSSVINFKTADWTTSGWVNRANITDQDIVFHLGGNLGNSNQTAPTADFTLAFNASAQTLSLKNYSSTSLTSTPDVDITIPVNAAEWHHFAIVRNGTTLTLYVDGVSAGSDNSFSLDIDPNYAEVAKFGAARVTGTGSTTARCFNGSMADLAIFNAALSAADITKMHSAPVADLGRLSASNVVTVTVGDPPVGINAWRQFYFETTENIGTAADSGDPDGDGITNAREYIFGTLPNEPDANPLNVASPGAGGISLSFLARKAEGAGYAGLARRYSVECTSDLANPLLWQPVTGFSNIIGENQPIAFTPANDGARCFYRLKIILE